MTLVIVLQVLFPTLVACCLLHAWRTRHDASSHSDVLASRTSGAPVVLTSEMLARWEAAAAERPCSRLAHATRDKGRRPRVAFEHATSQR